MNNDNLFLTKADKGNVTVFIESQTYTEKVETALGDMKYYPNLTEDPTNLIKKKMDNLLTKWERRGVFEYYNTFQKWIKT